MFKGDVINKLHDDDRLSDASTTKETDFSASEIRFK